MQKSQPKTKNTKIITNNKCKKTQPNKEFAKVADTFVFFFSFVSVLASFLNGLLFGRGEGHGWNWNVKKNEFRTIIKTCEMGDLNARSRFCC